MKAASEITLLTTSLISISIKNRDARGTIHRPDGADWATLKSSMHRLLVLRGLIPNDATRLPSDPWELFLSEFGQREILHLRQPLLPTPSYVPQSILVSSSSTSSRDASATARLENAPGLNQGGRHVRFAQQPQARRDTASRPIPRGVS
ncbi:hypothetical protein HFD88_004522 [Aspergillus terreus]|nr:hypothetical protein HFD88_004522 [Aspergillus terreus]